MSKMELIVNAIVTSIKTKKIDGKDYYMLSSKMNTNFLYNTNTTKMTNLTMSQMKILANQTILSIKCKKIINKKNLRKSTIPI